MFFYLETAFQGYYNNVPNYWPKHLETERFCCFKALWILLKIPQAAHICVFYMHSELRGDWRSAYNFKH